MKRYDLKAFIPLIRSIFILLLSITMAGCAVTGGSLMNASDQGQTAVIKDLLDKGADLNERGVCGGWDRGGESGATPLYCAAHGGHLEAVKLLVSKGADVNAKGNGFMTNRRIPLEAAAYASHAGIVKFLIENGADVDYALGNLKKLELKDEYEFLEKIVKEQRQAPKYRAAPSTLPSQLPTALPLPTEPAAPF